MSLYDFLLTLTEDDVRDLVASERRRLGPGSVFNKSTGRYEAPTGNTPTHDAPGSELGVLQAKKTTVPQRVSCIASIKRFDAMTRRPARCVEGRPRTARGPRVCHAPPCWWVDRAAVNVPAAVVACQAWERVSDRGGVLAPRGRPRGAGQSPDRQTDPNGPSSTASDANATGQKGASK